MDDLGDTIEQEPVARRTVDTSELIRNRRLVNGEALRKAINDGLIRMNITAAAAARQAGLRSPAALYNFRGYFSQTLNYATALSLSKVLGFDLENMNELSMPDLNEIEQIRNAMAEAGAAPELLRMIDRLRKLTASQAIGISTAMTAEMLANELLMVKVLVDDEGSRPSMALPAEMHEPLAGRMSSRDAGRRAFGVRVIGQAGEPAYVAGTVLICVPTDERVGVELADGRRVLTCARTTRPGRWKSFHVELREIRSRNGVRWLHPLGDDPQMPSLKLLGDMTSEPWTTDGYDIKVAGYVISAIVKEEGPQA